jgi:hypothetical protein
MMKLLAPSAGATRHEAGIDPQRLEELERLLDEEQRRESEDEH